MKCMGAQGSSPRPDAGLPADVVAYPALWADGSTIVPDIAGKAAWLATIRAGVAVPWRLVFLQVIGIVGGHSLFLLIASIE